MGEDGEIDRMLRWRGVTPGDQCPTCQGSGRRAYSNTSTWRNGIGGQAITDDVCDACWGSGDRFRSGCDLRKLRAEEDKRVGERAGELLRRASLVDFPHYVEGMRLLLEELAAIAKREMAPTRHRGRTTRTPNDRLFRVAVGVHDALAKMAGMPTLRGVE